MEYPSREYGKFKEFLDGFLIRRAKGEINATDFAEENFEYIRPNLDQLIPKLALTEATRVRVYFNDALIFHLSGGVEKPAAPFQQSLSPIPSFVEEAAEEEQCSRPKKQKTTNEQTAELSEVTSSTQTPFVPQEQTPLVAQEIRRTITPLMQSTPLGVPMTMEGALPTVWHDEEYFDSAQAFVDNLIAQIDISNVEQPPTSEQPIESNDQRHSEPDRTVFLSAAAAEVPFLRGIAEVRHTTPAQVSPERVRPRKQRPRSRIPVNEAATIPTKKMKKRIDFEVLRCIQPSMRSEEQTRNAGQTFVHVPLMIEYPGNVVNQILSSRGTPEKLRSHISQERLSNFSEVIRAYANERQISVAQPLQHSWRHRVASQSTTQSALQVSQISQSGEIVCQPTAMDVDYPSAVPHPLLRQQPLLTIPERDSSVELPLDRLYEAMPFNSSIENFPQPLANVSSIPLDISEEQPPVSCLPQEMPQDVEMLDVQQLPLSLDPLEQPVSGIPPSESFPQRDTGLVPTPLDSLVQFAASGIHPSQQIPLGGTDLPNSSTGQNQVELPATANEDVSWFEILRPREGLTYPMGANTRRRRKRRRREEVGPQPQIPVLPEIPPSPPHVPNELPNVPSFPVLPEDFSQQITDYPLPSNTEEMGSDLRGYFNLLKEAGNNSKYRTWERFDPYLFNEDDNFEMYTYILKRVIKDDYVAMDTLFEKGTIRLEVAKGFRFILELKAMDLIEIDAIDSRMTGFKFKPLDD